MNDSLDKLITDLKNEIMFYHMFGDLRAKEVELFEKCIEVLQEYKAYRWKNENKGAFFSGSNIHEKVKETDI